MKPSNSNQTYSAVSLKKIGGVSIIVGSIATVIVMSFLIATSQLGLTFYLSLSFLLLSLYFLLYIFSSKVFITDDAIIKRIPLKNITLPIDQIKHIGLYTKVSRYTDRPITETEALNTKFWSSLDFIHFSTSKEYDPNTFQKMKIKTIRMHFNNDLYVKIKNHEILKSLIKND